MLIISSDSEEPQVSDCSSSHECKQPDVFGPPLCPNTHLLWQKPNIPIFI